jgi:archaeal flagellin FlaB
LKINIIQFTEAIIVWNKLVKDEKGFTGLEAAIVLIAFVVVAAVFSYVMLGAGFFTTQKSQEVVHTGVSQASSSVELSGDVIATGDVAVPPTKLSTVTMCLQLTSGGSSVDMAKTLIVYSAPNHAPAELTLDADANPDLAHFEIVKKYNNNNNINDNLIDRGEKFDVMIPVDLVNGGSEITANKGFQIEIKPPQGATYTIHRTAPASIATIMTLV